jgi:hypothetical protein
MSSRLDRIIEEALADAGVKGADSVKTAKVAQIAGATDSVEKLASALDNIAGMVEVSLVKKSYNKDKSQEADFNETLRQVFTGDDTDEKTLQKREWIKRRIEQLGGVSAPTA